MADRHGHHAAAAVAAERHLTALASREPPGGLVELRFRLPGGAMLQRFYPTSRLRPVANTAVYLGREHDVYLGCAPRRRRAGGRSAIAHGWALWADCDTPQSTRTLTHFDPPPSLIVRSGSGSNCHAYWLLDQPVKIPELEELNLRLARALGADDHAYDAARVLRVAGTRNHKHNPPAPVTLEHATGELHPIANITAVLADADVDEPPRHLQEAHPPPSRPGKDALLAIAPSVYLHALTGLQAGRDGKVSCPFHADEDPSLHVYAEPARGWYCYGCQRGGSIYDLASELWLSGQSRDAPLRGRRFIEVRDRLSAIFLGERSASV